MGYGNKGDGRRQALKRDNRATAGLAIPGETSPVGLRLPNELSFEEWKTVVAQLTMITKACL